MGTFDTPAVGYEESGGGSASFSPTSFVLVARERETARSGDVTGADGTLQSLVLFWAPRPPSPRPHMGSRSPVGSTMATQGVPAVLLRHGPLTACWFGFLIWSFFS